MEKLKKYFMDKISEEKISTEFKENSNEEAKGLQKFKEQYSLETIRNLPLEKWTGGRETLGYNLEYGNYKRLGVHITGGPKGIEMYGIYKALEGTKYTYQYKDISYEEAVKKWRTMANDMATCLENIKNATSYNEILKNVKEKQNIAMMARMIIKLASIYYPNKILRITTKDTLLNIMVRTFKQKRKNLENLTLIELSFWANKELKENIGINDENSNLEEQIFNAKMLENICYHGNYLKEISNEDINDPSSDSTNVENLSKRIGKNIIVYGVPGSGKSYYVKNEIERNGIEFFERVIFYPEYSYYDFVGQKYPDYEEGKFKLKFEPGPFSRILKKAILDDNRNNHYYLAIEELNRGNAEAIFGDIFQLLDRDENGRSVYEIDNINIRDYINDMSDRKIDKLYLPENLTIYATINSADQNVFNLDTAFARRWEYEVISCKSKKGEKKYLNGIIIGTNGCKWEKLRDEINKIILQTEDIHNAEEKRLGLYYIDRDCLEDSEKEYSEQEKIDRRKKFANKIFRYLWSDVFRNCRNEIFKTTELKTLEDVINKFIANGKISEVLVLKFESDNNNE